MKIVPSLLLLSVAVCGCSNAKQSPEPVYPVSGVITLKGQPVVGADVTFMNAEKKRSAFGRTNEKGEYRLTTFSSNDGAVEGKAVVTIIKSEAVAPTVREADTESEAYEPPVVDFRPRMVPKEKPKPLLPERYSSQTTSGLMAMVSKDTGNELNFDLEQ